VGFFYVIGLKAMFNAIKDNSNYLQCGLYIKPEELEDISS